MTIKKAFVLMPFSEDLKDVYQYLICSSLEAAGYEVTRADDIKNQRNILADIIQEIASSHLIVADLTGSNPNVYYEVGVAHALDKNVILLTQNIDELPFDLRSYRVIPYSTYFTNMEQAKADLSELAHNSYSEKLPFGNPVKDFGKTLLTIPKVALEKSASPVTHTSNEMGLLDYSVQLEDGFDKITKIVQGVGEKLSNDLTPQINISTEKILSHQNSSREQLIIFKLLAEHLQEFASFIKPENEKYRIFIKNVENSLEYLLGENSDFVKFKDTQLQDLIDIWLLVENSLYQGREGTISLIETMDKLPRLETNFNRANSFMTTQLRDFVDNIDQTISIISRASRLAKSLQNRMGS